MAVTPFEDRKTVIDIIAADPYILSLGFTRSMIYNTAYTNDKLEADSKQIFVYNQQSSDGYNSIYISPTIQIDISVPLNEASKAVKAAGQIIALLQDKEINSHTPLELVSPSPVNLPCQFGYECIGLRFRYNATKFNTVKTIMS